MQHLEYYTDYRTYLQDYYDDHKRRFSFFSYRYFCQKSGISSPALFREVVNGHRNLTSKTTELFIKGLGLTERDAAYFRGLVQLNQSDSEPEKIEIIEHLRGLRKKVDQKNVPLDGYDFYRLWYMPVIRELACCIDWKEDYRILARSVYPAIKKSEAREAVSFLLKKGFLYCRDDGTYIQCDPALTTGSEVASVAIRAFNETMAHKGADAVQQFPATRRDVRTVITGVSETGYKQIKEEIREFIARVVRIVDDDTPADRVYSLNLQFFPVSQTDTGGDQSDETV